MTDDYEPDPDVETFHRMIRRGEIKSRSNKSRMNKTWYQERVKDLVADIAAPNGGLRPNTTRAQRLAYFVNRDRKS